MRHFLITILLLSATASSGQNLKEAKLRDPLVAALKKRDLTAISAAFSPQVYFQYVVVQSTYGQSEIDAFKTGKGPLFSLLFDPEYAKKHWGANAVPFARAIVEAGHTSINADPDDRAYLSSVTAFHLGFAYDLVLNCNDQRVCEIVGLNVSPAAGVGDLLLSSLPTQRVTYKRLTERTMLRESRKWHLSGIKTLVLYGPQKDALYGPNQRFKVAFTGTDAGSGGVVYCQINSKGLILVRHLTAINGEAQQAASSGKELEPGTFLGSNNQAIGIHADKEPAKATLEGRSPAGLLMTQGKLIQILKGGG